jgi:predicted protein tyrosine phosphatase
MSSSSLPVPLSQQDDGAECVVVVATPPSAPDNNIKLLMGEVRPGLWIGNLRSLKVLSKINTFSGGESKNANQWIVISVLESERLLQVARLACQSPANACLVKRHVEWVLPDECQADFLGPRLEEIFRTMDDHHDTQSMCLVHCAAGKSRSVAVCAAYLLHRRYATSLAQALGDIRTVRPCARPNLGFLAALRALQECRGEVATAVQRMQLPNKNRSKEQDEDRMKDEECANKQRN